MDVEQRARELLAAACPRLKDEYFDNSPHMTAINLHEALIAVRSALTPPEGYVPMDKGPWAIYQNGSSVVSDDFTHDVLLKISGDFCADTRQKYAEWLVSVLNAARMEVK